MRKVQERRMKGITLIALVITIVILLILAGITISALSGENGILKRAAEAKEQNVRGVEEEAISIAYTGVLTKNNMEAVTSGTAVQGVTAGDLEEELHKNGHEDATATGTGTITVTFSNSGNSYTVDANTGKVGEIRVSDESDSDEVSKILSPVLDSSYTGVALLKNGKVVKLASEEYSTKVWSEVQVGEELNEINGVKKSFIGGYGRSYYIIDNSGNLWSWGDNGSGQLGIGSTVSVTEPQKIEGLTGIVDLYFCEASVIARDSSGNLWSWGENSAGQLGIGSKENATTPQQINGLSGITDVYIIGLSIIAKDSSGNLWSWGSNADGRLGIGSTENATTPQQIEGLSGITDVYLSDYSFLIAKDSSGNLWSWGSNTNGQLGIGSTENATTPQQINVLSGITDVYMYGYSVIVKDNNKNLWSWGSNSYGILGIGEGSSLYVPTKLNDNENIVFYGKDIEELYLQGNYYVVKTSDGKLYRYQKESMPI